VICVRELTSPDPSPGSAVANRRRRVARVLRPLRNVAVPQYARRADAEAAIAAIDGKVQLADNLKPLVVKFANDKQGGGRGGPPGGGGGGGGGAWGGGGGGGWGGGGGGWGAGPPGGGGGGGPEKKLFLGQIPPECVTVIYDRAVFVCFSPTRPTHVQTRRRPPDRVRSIQKTVTSPRASPRCRPQVRRGAAAPDVRALRPDRRAARAQSGPRA